MGIPILVRQHLYIETAPRFLFITWVWQYLKSLGTQLFVQQLTHANNKEKLKVCIISPLYRELPLTSVFTAQRANNAESVSKIQSHIHCDTLWLLFISFMTYSNTPSHFLSKIFYHICAMLIFHANMACLRQNWKIILPAATPLCITMYMYRYVCHIITFCQDNIIC